MRRPTAIGAILLALCWGRTAAAQTAGEAPLPAPPVALEPVPESQPALPPTDHGFDGQPAPSGVSEPVSEVAPAAPLEASATVEHAPSAAPEPSSQAASAPGAAGPRSATSPLGPIAGACVGCSVCGGLPDALTIASGTMFVLMMMEAMRASGCGGIVVVVLGTLFFGLPAIASGAVAGLAAPLGATVGTSIGAALAGRPFWVPLLGGTPGLLVGLTGSALAVASVTVLADARLDPIIRDQSPQITLLLAGLALALAGGPVALAGALGSDLVFAAVAGE